jgi:hypothetical protein
MYDITRVFGCSSPGNLLLCHDGDKLQQGECGVLLLFYRNGDETERLPEELN